MIPEQECRSRHRLASRYPQVGAAPTTELSHFIHRVVDKFICAEVVITPYYP